MKCQAKYYSFQTYIITNKTSFLPIKLPEMSHFDKHSMKYQWNFPNCEQKCAFFGLKEISNFLVQMQFLLFYVHVAPPCGP